MNVLIVLLIPLLLSGCAATTTAPFVDSTVTNDYAVLVATNTDPSFVDLSLADGVAADRRFGSNFSVSEMKLLPGTHVIVARCYYMNMWVNFNAELRITFESGKHYSLTCKVDSAALRGSFQLVEVNSGIQVPFELIRTVDP